MDQRGSLQRILPPLAFHMAASHAAQLIVNLLRQLIERGRISGRPRLQQIGDFSIQGKKYDTPWPLSAHQSACTGEIEISELLKSLSRMEITMKQISMAFTLAAAVLVVGMSPAAKANDKGCTASSLIGTFAYTGTGAITAPPEIAGSVAEVGTDRKSVV